MFISADRMAGQKPTLNTKGIVAYYYTEQIAQKLGIFRKTHMVCPEKHRSQDRTLASDYSNTKAILKT